MAVKIGYNFLTKFLFLLFVMSFTVVITSAQTITYTKLSKKYNYRVNVNRVKSKNREFPEVFVILELLDKKQHLLQTIKYHSDFLFDETFKTSKSSRSYITGFNKDAEVADNDFGDLIVADLNFDGKEDLAIKQQSGNRGGEYLFYLQQNNGTFALDRYLTEEVTFFPLYIEPKRHTITTDVIANVKGRGETTYKYYPKLKRWKFIKNVFIPTE